MKDIKRLFIDIETGKSEDADLFKPEFKEPKINKDGSVSKASKTIEEQQTDFDNKCALNPLTGQVLMVGYDYDNEGIKVIDINSFDNESDVLDSAVTFLNHSDKIIGHYLKSFDLPFIINRCRKYGINKPNVGKFYKGRWYWNENVIDLADLWTLGKYGEYISLNNMAKYFGLNPKDETIAPNFQEVFNSDINKAIEYCKYDVELTKQIYERLK